MNDNFFVSEDVIIHDMAAKTAILLGQKGTQES